jgi:bifunctional non-homologous end joining protein LigD
VSAIGLEFMQPTSAASLSSVPGDWLAQPKVDGWRMMIHKGRYPAMWTRNGMRKKVPPLIAELLPEGSYVLDAEIYDPRVPWSLRLGSVPALSSNDVNLFAAVFDIFKLNGVDMRRRPLRERLGALTDLVDPRLLVPTDTPQVMWERVLLLDAEGMVVKNPQSLYTNGRTDQWLKVKNRTITEVIVEGWAAEGYWACVTPDGRRLRLDNMPGRDVVPNLRLAVEHTGFDSRGRMVEPQLRTR